MSTLNEEIIDALSAARLYITGDRLVHLKGKREDERQTQHDLNQLDRILAYFKARRNIEERRVDDPTQNYNIARGYNMD